MRKINSSRRSVLSKVKSMQTKELLTLEAQIIADLRRRHHSGDNDAAKILLEHIRATRLPPTPPKKTGGIFDELLEKHRAVSRSAMMCNHANECPAVCPCDADCYCRVKGNCR